MTLSIEKESPPLRIDDSGVIRVGNSRVTLDVVIDAFKAGLSAEAIAEEYDAVTLAEVYAVIGFYLAHQFQVDAYLLENTRRTEAVRSEIESKPDYKRWRERLLARANQAGLSR